MMHEFKCLAAFYPLFGLYKQFINASVNRYVLLSVQLATILMYIYMLLHINTMLKAN